ncbi:MAG: hypothetical protein ACFHHU_00090 [Porticoccaceae bacterium]
MFANLGATFTLLGLLIGGTWAIYRIRDVKLRASVVIVIATGLAFAALLWMTALTPDPVMKESATTLGASLSGLGDRLLGNMLALLTIVAGSTFVLSLVRFAYGAAVVLAIRAVSIKGSLNRKSADTANAAIAS